MQLSDINPFIRYARAHRVAFRTQKEISICYDCRVFFFDNVSGSVSINQKLYQLHNKSVLFLPPETAYRFNILFKETAKVIVLDFDLTYENAHLENSLGTATEKTFDNTLVPPYSLPSELSQPIMRVVPQLERMLTQCTEYYFYKNPYYRESSSAVLKLCLLELLRQQTPEQRGISAQILRYIHENFARSDLTNQALAEKFNYHPDYLSSLIRQETGMALHQYLIRYRLQIAKDYLLTTEYDISEIAWRCGFCTAAYFTKLFRQNTGITPREYRRLQIHTEF